MKVTSFRLAFEKNEEKTLLVVIKGSPKHRSTDPLCLKTTNEAYLEVRGSFGKIFQESLEEK